MTPQQNLHSAIGKLAYAIARSDGEVQKEEREKFQAIVAAELRCKDWNFDISDIAFKMLEKEKFIDSKTSYDWAMKEIKLNSHYLSPEMKKTFIKVIEKIARSFPPVTKEEASLIEQFKHDIEEINGDPVYYGS